MSQSSMEEYRPMSENKEVSQVGVRFMRFCAKYDLNRISEQAQLYVEPFNARLVQ